MIQFFFKITDAIAGWFLGLFGISLKGIYNSIDKLEAKAHNWLDQK